MNPKIKKIFFGALLSILLVSSLVIASMKNTSVKAESPKKAKNVIMLIGDGMSTEAITLARWYNNGQPLTMDEISVGAVKTYWADGPITDSAPGGTAYSVGQKTKNKYVGVSKDKKPLATILEAAKLDGKATGLVFTCEAPHATPADFSAHIDSRSNYDAIIKQQVYNGLDVVLGGGKKYSEVYKDELLAKGYDYVTTKQEMLQSTSNKIWGMFADIDMAYDIDREKTRPEEPTLAEMTRKAIEVLSKDKDGFFLMVEGSKIDWAAHANDPVGIVTDIIAFDRAVKEAVDFAKQDGNTVVIVTTDHGNSGISIGNFETGSTKDKRFSYDNINFVDSVNKIKNVKMTTKTFNNLIVGKSDDEIKSMVLENYGINDLNEDEFKKVKANKINEVISDRVKIGFTTRGHTGEDVYLGVYAPFGVEKLKGVVDNTEVNRYMQRILLGKERLSALTEELFVEGKSAFEAKGATVDVIIPKVQDPKDATKEVDDLKNTYVIITKGSDVLKLYMYTNKYELNGNMEDIDSVMPYISGKFYIPTKIVNLIK